MLQVLAPTDYHEARRVITAAVSRLFKYVETH